MHTEEKHLVADKSEPNKISEDEINKAISDRAPNLGFFEGIGFIIGFIWKRCLKVPNLTKSGDNRE